jgi:hypothetical protein
MNISTVIAQLKAFAPAFNGNVAGAASYVEGLETVVSLPLPAAFIYPLADDPDNNENMGWGLRQTVEERIAIVIQADNTADRRGQAAAVSIEELKYAVFAAILNWNPSGQLRANQGLRYGGGHLLGMDRARIFWQLEMVLAAVITENDGFTVAGQPLTQIDIYNQTQADVAAGIVPVVELGIAIIQS